MSKELLNCEMRRQSSSLLTIKKVNNVHLCTFFAGVYARSFREGFQENSCVDGIQVVIAHASSLTIADMIRYPEKLGVCTWFGLLHFIME